MDLVYDMEMPVFIGKDYSKIYGDIAESLVVEILKECNKQVETTEYHCPIDLIIDNEYGAEIKYRATNQFKVLSFMRHVRQTKLNFCKEYNLKPLTILVFPVSQERVRVTVRTGIKNISKGYEGIDLEDFINAMDSRKGTK
jgi:hypothetical protein